MNNASLELGGTNWAEKDASLLGYTVSDDSGRFSPQEFTFARGSNLSATRIDRAGLIVKGRENLLLQSNQFDTTWTTSNASVTSGQSGYDGTNDAWKLESTTTGGSFVKQDLSQSGVSTSSIYLKAGNANFVYFRVGGGTSQGGFINLTNGSVSDLLNSPIEIKATSVGNGWFRCVVVVNTSLTNVRYYVGDSAGSTSSNIGSFVYIQDAQLEIGLAASPYIPTTTTSAQAGVLENTPRLNYTTGVANPYLLLEPSRSNLFPQSEYYASGAWTIQAISTTANAVVSPEGLQNASKLIPNSGTGGNRSLGKGFTGLSGIHTFSTFAKAGEYGYVSLRLRNGPSAFVMFDLNDGSIHNENNNAQSVAGSAKIEDYGNGWYRCSVSFDPSGSATVGDLFPSLSVGITGDETFNWDGDGVSGIYIYGMQFEAGSYAASYIPTYSVSATRARDTCGKTNASGEINSTEGVLYTEIAKNNVLGSEGGLFLRKDTSNEIRLNLAPNNRINLFVNVGGVLQVYMDNSTFTLEDYNKIAVKYKLNDYSVFVNGTKIYTDTSALVPADMNELKFNSLYGKVNAIQVYKEALTDAELATLTTI